MHGENPPTNAPPVHGQLTETPSSRKDGGPAGLFGNTQEARAALLKELCQVQVVKLREFLSLVLPLPKPVVPLPTVSDVIQDLKNNGTLVPTDATYPHSGETIFRWADFDQDPAEMKGIHETVVFQRMLVIVDKIKGAVEARQGPPTTMTYVDEPNRPPRSDRRTNLTRPDGFFYFNASGELPTGNPQARRWYNIGVVAEYKKRHTAEEIHDNVHKILWGLNHIMREDASRRYTLGFTIENRTMMLWYCDRSQVAVSTSFDFIQMPNLLVDFFMRVMYAPRSALGCDPTMRLVNPSSDAAPQYDITIHTVDAKGKSVPRQYRTKKIISDAAADGIVTRGTRVWSAYELDGARRSCVIKDYWVDCDRDAEGDILARIKNTFPRGTQHYNTLNRHLLTVLSHGRVPRDSQHPLVADTTLDIPASARAQDKFYWVAYLDHVMGMARNNPSNMRTHHGPSSFVDRFANNNLQHGQRSHCRIAFAEEGTPLHQFTSLAVVFSALCDVAECLSAIHAAGWVHRDISSGNIIVLKDGNKYRGVLTDFEYAKHRDDTRGAHLVRTGTLYFMSVEVDAEKYLFSSGLPNDPGFTRRYDFNAPFKRGTQRDMFNTKKTKPSFRYHPLNDWESVFWVATHFVIDREVTSVETHDDSDEPPPTQSEEDRAAQIRWARLLFYDRIARRDVFTSPGQDEFTDGNQCVHEEISFIASWHLEDMRKALVSAYKSVEVGSTPPTFEKSANCGVAFLLKSSLEWVKNYLAHTDIKVGHFQVLSPPQLVPEEFEVLDGEIGVDVHPMVTHTEDFPTLNVHAQ